MNPFVRQAANRLFEIAVGLAAGCLALRIARLVESCIPWALVRFGGAAAMRGSFGEGIALPPDSPWAFHALHAFGEALLPAAAVVSATWLVPRLPRAAAPAAAFAAFWFAASAARELAVYARFGRGSVQTLVNAAGLPWGDSAAPRLVGVALLAGVLLYLLRRAVRGARLYPLTAFLMPCAILYLALPEARAGGRLLQRLGIEHLPLILAAAAALAAWKWKPRDAAGGKTAFAVPAALGAAAFFAPVTLDPTAAPREAVRWVEAKSADWQLFFEENRFDEAERERWLRAATLRNERLRKRLGIRARGEPVRAHVAKTWQAFQQIARDRRYQGNFYPRSASGPVALAGPGNRPDDALAEPLMLMRGAWGAPASDAMARRRSPAAPSEISTGTISTTTPRASPAKSGPTRPPRSSASTARISRPWCETRFPAPGSKNFVSRRGAGALQALYRRELGQALALCAPTASPDAANRPGGLQQNRPAAIPKRHFLLA